MTSHRFLTRFYFTNPVSALLAIAMSTEVYGATFDVVTREDLLNVIAKIQAAQFLSHATFGPTEEEISDLATRMRAVGTSNAASEWIDRQFAMAPEEFRGQSDARSDVYSLGLTLFELLTLRPAFDETRNGLLANPLASRSIPRLRWIDRSFPRDLDTIVAKATDSDPKHRCASAGDLASDLRAYLDGRAIRARRASSLEHAWRWCRRNPAPAASALLVAASLITATVVSLWSGRQTKLALVQAS